MSSKKIMKYLLFCLLFLSIISCRYNKILKGDDYDVKFVAAGEYFIKKEYSKAIALYEQYYQRFPKTDKGEVSYYRIGKAYFADGNFYMGGYYLNSFSGRFPGNIKCEETAFYSAICTVRNSPESSLDQAETQAGLAELQNFIARYPSSMLVDTCNLIMDELRGKLELKDLDAVRLYHKTENHNAASTTAEVFLKKYPKSKAREEVFEMMCSDSYFFAINSISEKKKERLELTKKRITTFVGEFPETKSKSRLEDNLMKIDLELSKLKKQ
jgi:outer membrane protein assembly factor BamD